MTTLPNGAYDVVLMDPPWEYSNSKPGDMGAAINHYPTMTDQELRDLDVAALLSRQSVVFMWATAPRLDFAIDLLRHWGLAYRGVAFVWVKTRKDGVTPIGAQGVRPSIVKPTTEYVLAASVVKKGRPRPLADESVPHVVLAAKTGHSRKPDEVHRRIERLYPDASKIELFARREMDGWTVWGNEV